MKSKSEILPIHCLNQSFSRGILNQFLKMVISLRIFQFLFYVLISFRNKVVIELLPNAFSWSLVEMCYLSEPSLIWASTTLSRSCLERSRSSSKPTYSLRGIPSGIFEKRTLSILDPVSEVWNINGKVQKSA